MALADDPRSPEALADPAGFFRRLREHDPVHWSGRARAWVVTSHAEVTAAFRDDARLSSDRLAPIESGLSDAERAAMARTFALLRGWMVFRDSDDHARLRGPVRRVFTPHQVDRLAPRIQAIVDELLDEMAAQGRCELVGDFAFPLPAIVIAELLGVPPEDREKFKTWAAKLGALVFGALERSDRHEVAREGAAEFTDYFERLIRRYEERPADNLISRLIAARDAGDALGSDQVVGACTLLLFGGHETTTGLIANGMATLLEHPDQLELLRRRPELAPSAVEELLRVAGPAKLMVRYAKEAHRRGGHRLGPGERVYLAIAGANRDPAVFPEPDRFDITRHPNPHLGFGHGQHFCLGANLARREVQIALSSLLARFPKLRLSRPVEWTGTIIGTGVAGVPLELA